MPTSGEYSYGPADVHRWHRCRQQVAAQMLADGWNRHARKFSEVQKRRAWRLYAAKATEGAP